MAAGEEDVLRLDVTVHDARLVRHRERLGDFTQQAHRLLHRQLAGAREPLAEGLSLDEGHHVVEEPRRLTGVEQSEDVRMHQPRRDLDLAREAFGAHGGAEFRTQHLERHLAVVLEILGEVDRRHPPLAELALDPVAIGEGGGERAEGRVRGGLGCHGEQLWMGRRRCASKLRSGQLSIPPLKSLRGAPLAN